MARAGDGDDRRQAFEVLDPAPVGVAVTHGADHQLIYTNTMFRSQFGDCRIGISIKDSLAQPVRVRYSMLFDQVYATGETIALTAEPAWTRGAPHGEAERFFTSSLSRISYAPGDHGVLVVAMEVTEQIDATRQMRAIAEERSHILRRYRTLMRVSAQIVWVAGPDGSVIEPSPSWERITGQEWEEFQGPGWLDMVHPDDRAETSRVWAAALKSVSKTYDHVYRLRTADGSYRHFRALGVPIYENGELVEWVGSCNDIEQQWQERRCQDLLDRVAAATAELSSLPEMLGALADVIVPELADGCGVHLISDLAEDQPDGPILVERVATAARDGLPRLSPYREDRMGSGNAFVRAVRRRRQLHKTFPEGNPPRDLAPPETEQWMRENAANSLLILPVVVDGAVPAVVTVVATGDRPPISQADIALLSRMFDHVHDALSSAIRFQRAQQIALTLQHGMLTAPPRLPDLRIAARYRASPVAAEVGGDWYDSFVLPGGSTVVAIGDVAGHDLGAAVIMSQLRSMLRALVLDRSEPPGKILSRLNATMESLSADVTATCVLARVEASDEGYRLYYAVAGHPPPVLVGSEGTARFLDGAVSPLLGVPHDLDRPSTAVPLPPGSTLLLYTDGLVERPGEHLDLGLERLRRLAASLAGESVEEFCDQLLSGLPTTGLDDIALIAMRRTGG